MLVCTELAKNRRLCERPLNHSGLHGNKWCPCCGKFQKVAGRRFCLDCKKKLSQKWAKDNREERRKYQQKWAKDNREEIRKYQREWYKNNLERWLKNCLKTKLRKALKASGPLRNGWPDADDTEMKIGSDYLSVDQFRRFASLKKYDGIDVKISTAKNHPDAVRKAGSWRRYPTVKSYLDSIDSDLIPLWKKLVRTIREK